MVSLPRFTVCKVADGGLHDAKNWEAGESLVVVSRLELGKPSEPVDQ
jgi:hypothetical protein